MRRHSQTKHARPYKNHWLLTGSIVIAVEVLVVAFLLVAGGRATTREPRIPHGVSLASWSENGHSGHYVLQIVEGNAPAAGKRVLGVVTGDTTCRPDVQGLSHCHNGIDLVNGGRLTVVNTHLMMRYPCLHPGETVTLSRINASWVLAWIH